MGKSKKKDKKKEKKQEKAEKRRREAEAEQDRKRRKAEKKARDKASETPEERNARRLAKKLAKQAKQKEEKELFGYTNEANPFNDPNLTKAFVWKKKFDKDKATGKSRQTLTKKQLKEKQIKLRHEIEKVKERRTARELEKEQMDLMREQMEKEAIIDAVEGWEEREEEFHRQQAHRRSEIRIKEGREKAIDILAKNLKLSSEDNIEANISVDLDVELTEPHKIFDGLARRDLDDLYRDLKIHLDLNTGDLYWKALITICEDELHKHDNGGSGAYGLQDEVYEQIVGLLEGKNYKQLIALEKDVKRKLKGVGDEAVDIQYWENLYKHLQIFKAKAHLTDFHKALLKKRLMQLKNAHFNEDSDEQSGSAAEEEEDWEPELIPHHAVSEADKAKAEEEDSDEDFEPVLLQDADAEALAEAIDPEQDKKELEARRRVILEAKEDDFRQQQAADEAEREAALETQQNERTLGTKRFMMSADDMYSREANKELEEGEEVFKSELATPEQTYWWHDKYRPRKPRYFNRVRTGFEWNKYNQTHYDKENPPPKIVQGYKFNIFYPDMIEAGKPPRYYLEDTDDKSKDHCLIRFTAGAPYEDVAFKIVRKEWEYNHKRGFKCVFDRGVLHLYFNFRRYRYRR